MTRHTRPPVGHGVDRRRVLAMTGLGTVSLLSACGDLTSSTASTTTAPETGSRETDRIAMTVYKDAGCQCCTGWMEHANANGFDVTAKHPENLAMVWVEHDIPLDLQSCHLGLTESGDGFVGHVPARYMHEYLADPPKGGRGLSVPQMPVGTPGMEQGDQFDPYEIMLITDGEPQVFAHVRRASDQTAEGRPTT